MARKKRGIKVQLLDYILEITFNAVTYTHTCLNNFSGFLQEVNAQFFLSYLLTQIAVPVLTQQSVIFIKYYS